MTSSDTLYTVSAKLIAGRESWFPKIDKHDPVDSESSDLLWLSRHVDNESCEGEVITVSPLGGNRWYAAHDYADNYGGWPTVWSASGDESEVIVAILAYLETELPDVLARA